MYIFSENVLKATALITPKHKWEGQWLKYGFYFVTKVEQCLSATS